MWKSGSTVSPVPIARRIARKGYEEVEKASCRLLHDIGRYWRLSISRKCMDRRLILRDNALPLIDVENQLIGFDHANATPGYGQLGPARRSI